MRKRFIGGIGEFSKRIAIRIDFGCPSSFSQAAGKETISFRLHPVILRNLDYNATRVVVIGQFAMRVARENPLPKDQTVGSPATHFEIQQTSEW